ncbi:retrotransposon protein, putative, ty1-copia subclass [Tanacetum coccineum]|uniref:Retrotransposon protein, putative, ty1-copia subclass n=1 Tax=Tanacetum coccineum TaxID=301880 RepID=A0ABQ5E6N1_9ASTR
MVRSMMSQTTLPKFFWDYALESAARILNMVPTKKVDKTPYEIWHGQAPKLSYLKVWGCEALVKRDTLTKPDKLEPRSFKCIFIGYPKETMRYSFYNPSENKVFVARNAEFFESNLIDQEASGILEDLEIIQKKDTNPSLDTSLNHEEDDQEIDEPQSDINPIRRSTRTRRPIDRLCLYIDAEEHELGDLDNDGWELVELPPNARTIGHKWLFKKNTDMDDIRAISIIIAIATFYDYEIWQMDIKTAFLNGHLSEEVYMTQPEGDGSKRLIGLCQSVYIEKILKRYYSKRGAIPMQDKLKLSKSDGASTPAEKRRMSNVPHASAVGSIMYANPGELHWMTVKNILKYLRNTKDMFMVYEGDMKRELRVSCYIDAGYLTDADDLSTKQSIFATSSTDAEYIAAFDASKEAVWIRKFISGLNVVPTIEEPITMYCDNTGAIAIANDHGVTKVPIDDIDLSLHSRAEDSKNYSQRAILDTGDAFFIPERWTMKRYLDSATEEAIEEFRRFKEEMEQQSNKELQGLLSISKSERRIGKSMEKAVSYTSNKYVEADLNSAT